MIKVKQKNAVGTLAKMIAKITEESLVKTRKEMEKEIK